MHTRLIQTRFSTLWSHDHQVLGKAWLFISTTTDVGKSYEAVELVEEGDIGIRQISRHEVITIRILNRSCKSDEYECKMLGVPGISSNTKGAVSGSNVITVHAHASHCTVIEIPGYSCSICDAAETREWTIPALYCHHNWIILSLWKLNQQAPKYHTRLHLRILSLLRLKY